jgi:hypothetical protein
MNELNDRQIHKKFIKLGTQRIALTRKLFALIPEIEKRKIYLHKGCKDIQEYALKYAGLSYSAVRNCISVIKKAKNFPLIASEIENVGIYKAELALKIANKENESIVVDKMKNMSRSAFKLLVAETKNHGFSDRKCSAVPMKKSICLKGESLKIFNRLKFKLKMENEEELILKILKLAEGQILKDLENTQKMRTKRPRVANNTGHKFLPAGISRYIPSAIRSEVVKRSDGLCQYPNCSSQIDTFHHIDRFSENKNHNNIIGLCKAHHEFAHNNLIDESSLKFRFEEGIRKFEDFQRREIIQEIMGINSG